MLVVSSMRSSKSIPNPSLTRCVHFLPHLLLPLHLLEYSCYGLMNKIISLCSLLQNPEIHSRSSGLADYTLHLN